MSNCVSLRVLTPFGAQYDPSVRRRIWNKLRRKPGAPIGGSKATPIHTSISLEGRSALPEQFSLFADRLSGPEGLRYAEEFVSPALEKTLIGHIAALPLQPFQFGQYEGKRRVASFGFRYDYAMRRLEEADPIPEWLGPIIEKVEAFGGRGTRDWSGPLHRVRRRCRHRLAPRQAALRPGVRPVAGLRRASSGFEGPPAPSGNVLRSRPSHVRST